MIPLEIWDMTIEGISLFAARERVNYATYLRRAIETLLAHDPRCVGVERLWLCGGGAHDPALVSALSSLSVPCERAHDGVFFAALTGCSLHDRSTRFGLTLDSGQTALKLVWPTGRLAIARPDEASISTRDALARFFASALVAARARAGRAFDALLWALPSELDAALNLAGSSYSAMRGDRSLIDATLALAAFDAVPTRLLNDAELAALALRAERPDAPRTLVLTLGYGVGAAVLQGVLDA